MGTQVINIEARRAQDYERYEAQRRFEESTDIAERLGYPIDVTIEYEMRDHVAYALSDTKDRPFHDQTAQALREGKTKFTGDQSFEVTRLGHEHDEALMVDDFGNGELPGNLLIKFSKVPDAVANGMTDIIGYRRDLLRSFVRVYRRQGNRVSCRLFTLDHNDPNGLEAIQQLVDMDLGRNSEVILADYTLLNVPENQLDDVSDQLCDRIKLGYDEAIFRARGKRTYAGSEHSDYQEAMGVITKYSLLMDEHMRTIDKIKFKGYPKDMEEELLEGARKNVAAAIKLASQGHDIQSASDPSVAAEVAQNDYGRECATATNGMNQAQSPTPENQWKFGKCRNCLEVGKVGDCSVCMNCERADNRGEDLNLIHGRAVRRVARAAQAMSVIATKNIRKESKLSKTEEIKQLYGDHFEIKTEPKFGDAQDYLINKRTGKKIEYDHTKQIDYSLVA